MRLERSAICSWRASATCQCHRRRFFVVVGGVDVDVDVLLLYSSSCCSNGHRLCPDVSTSVNGMRSGNTRVERHLVFSRCVTRPPSLPHLISWGPLDVLVLHCLFRQRGQNLASLTTSGTGRIRFIVAQLEGGRRQRRSEPRVKFESISSAVKMGNYQEKITGGGAG